MNQKLSSLKNVCQFEKLLDTPRVLFVCISRIAPAGIVLMCVVAVRGRLEDSVETQVRFRHCVRCRTILFQSFCVHLVQFFAFVKKVSSIAESVSDLLTS